MRKLLDYLSSRRALLLFYALSVFVILLLGYLAQQEMVYVRYTCVIISFIFVCVLLGERPGLATAESMSAYLAYNARVGMPESRRTVVSNIHKDGIPAAEAGAYIADVIGKMLDQKASGVDLRKG